MNTNFKETLFGSVDLSVLQKWKGDFSVTKEEYLDFLKKKPEDTFCVEFCTGCGRVLAMDKDMAMDFYRGIFMGVDHPLLVALPFLDKSVQYIETDVCDNCAEDFTRQEKENKNLSVVAIPTIKNI